MVTDLRSAVEWLTTLRVPWTLQELADLADAKLDRAQYYATRLERIGVLTRAPDGRYLAGPASALWRKQRPQSHPGGNAAGYRRQREIRETLRAREFQAVRAGTAIALPVADDHLASLATKERVRTAATGNRLTCNETPIATTGHQEEPEVTIGNLLTPEAVAEQLGVHANTVLRAINRGDLPAIRLGARLLRIREVDLIAYIEKGAQKLRERVR